VGIGGVITRALGNVRYSISLTSIAAQNRRS